MRTGTAPAFWWTAPSLSSRAMAPASWAYGALARRQLRRATSAEVGVPVVCVGNFTVGGGGKTPTAIALGVAAREAGFTPGFVTRGHGRKEAAAVLVDARQHTVFEVGDEPLLLAEVAPTAVSVRRIDAARLLTDKCGVDFVIMDDGFQSARLAIDYAVLAVDARRGIGNGAVVPAGPLRAPVAIQMPRADAVLIIGEGSAGDRMLRTAARANRVVYTATTEPRDEQALRGMKVLAFAGIADPSKFYALLGRMGATVVVTRDFPDHHMFDRGDMEWLSAAAGRHDLQLITTRKDAVRLSTGGRDAKIFAEGCRVLDVTMRFDPPAAPARVIRDTYEAFTRRRFASRS